MAWKQLNKPCPKCGEPLFEDTSSGDECCMSCDYEKGLPESSNMVVSMQQHVQTT